MAEPPPAHDALPCAWLELDGAGLLRDANGRLAQLVGRPLDALRGQPFDTLLSPPSRVIYQSVLQPLLKLHGQVSELALTLRGAAGEPVDVLFYSARAAGRPDAPTQVLLAPIRQRRRIEAELLRVKRAADQAPGMVFELQAGAAGSHRFVYASEAVRTLFGVSPEAAAADAQAVLGRIDATDRERWQLELAQAAERGGPWQTRCRVRAPGDTLRTYEWHAVPRRLDAATVLWHGHVADVTEAEQWQAALQERAAMEQLARARSEFIGRVSHELRTPLNGILGFAELLQQDADASWTPPQREWLGIIERSGLHLLGVVNQLLEVSHIESGQLTLDLSALPLRPQVEQALAVVGEMARQAGVTLAEPRCDPALAVLAEPLRLQQVLVNLLGNAVKYNRPQGRVQVLAHAEAGQVRLDIVDTGLGLSPQQCRDLFQPFNRLGAERTSTQGAGLGLVITRHLVQLMGGELSVNSRPGEGSTFSVRLAQADVPAPAPAPATPAVEPAPTAAQVLYVDDNPLNCKLMVAFLRHRPGVALRVAVDGADALAHARRWRPDLLLLDLHLPDMSGHELLRRLRDDLGLRDVPAVAVSAAADADSAAGVAAAGFDDLWVKPLNLQRTLDALDAWLLRARGAVGPS